MGLDMYLDRAKKTEVGYWRKANHIHNWFNEKAKLVFENCGGIPNCVPLPVSAEMLGELLDTCKKVLANHTLAEELLPTQEGFFFGSTEYDEFYFEDVEDTIKIIEKVLKETNWKEESITYMAWW